MTAANKRSYTRRDSAGGGAGGKSTLLTGRRIGSLMAQSAGFYTTWLFIGSLGASDWLQLGLAAGLDWLLFLKKREVLSGDSPRDISGWLAIAADTVTNAGGLWVVVLALDKTASYKMLAQGLGLGESMRLLPALIIALLLGLWLAVEPYRMWRQG